jgi:putative acyl-CoA dehydrogenase
VPTHEVLNQPPPLVDVNLYTADPTLPAAVRREGRDAAREAEGALAAFGARLGGAEAQEWAAQANEHPPVLRAFDRFGHRIDEVEYHPAYHAMLALSVEHGLAGGPWAAPRPGAHVVRAAGMLLASQVEFGHLCPVSMTYSAVPALRRQPDLLAEWGPRATSRRYDPRPLPATEKRGVLLGMAMTEKQGGSDVRANTTRAEPDGEAWRLTGHKWFCSAPMCDAFLVLAQRPQGPTCFLLPRRTPDGARNRFHIMRLKDKLGNRSNASSEIELNGAWARLVGEEGRGVATIVEMVNHTRLDCVLGSAGLMRQAVAQALHHARHRAAFGRRLVEQPLMKNVLADLWLESEAALQLAVRLAASYDQQEAGDPHRPLRRIATAVAKYWVCKRAPGHIAEALECLGGNGFVEEAPLARLYREAPLNSIWEGSGNVICLDVLRAMAREPGTVEALLGEIGRARGADARLDRHVRALEEERPDPGAVELAARRFVERLALALQASLLVRHAAPAVADAFIASRLEGDRGSVYGTLGGGVDVDAVLRAAAATG